MKSNQQGAVSALLISTIALSLLLVGAASFAIWAYLGRQDYKNNLDEKVQTQTKVIEQQISTQKDNEYLEKEKLPLKTYNGPSAYGSISLQYPKTWSGYVVEASNNNNTLDGYFYPGVVPSVNDTGKAFALRIQVVNRQYSQVLQEVQNSQQSATNTITSYALPKVPDSVGVIVKGDVGNNKTGSMVVLPLRDKTIKIWTEGGDFQTDFDNNILPNFSFQP